MGAKKPWKALLSKAFCIFLCRLRTVLAASFASPAVRAGPKFGELFLVRLRVACERVEVKVQRHQFAEAREHLIPELRREEHALGIVVIADGDVFCVVPRI